MKMKMEMKMLRKTIFVGSRHSVKQVAKMYDSLVKIVAVDSSTWRIIWDDSNKILGRKNISELRDTCRKLLETTHSSDYARCKAIGCQFFDEKMEFNCCANENLCEQCINSQHLPGSSPG